MAKNKEQTELKNFLPLCKLGQGAFSTVYKVKRITDGQIYALKKIKMQKLKEKQKENALNEIRILASIKSKYIICYKQAFYDYSLNLLCIVMEYANGGDLQNKISDHQKSKLRFPQKQIWKAASELLISLYILHEKGILHRDLKSANVFISNEIYKLGDLNVSKVNHQKDQMAKTQTGTPYYASPQVWRDQLYDSKCDIWSYGCLLYQMCCFQPPFRGSDLDQLYKAVQKGKYAEIPSMYSGQLSNLIRSCLKVNQKQRASAKQLMQRFKILNQNYMQSLKNNQIETACSLLNTIRLPFDLRDLSKNLPIAEYQLQLKQQPRTMYQQNQKDKEKQTILLKNKLLSQQKQKNQILPLPERIKKYFNQNRSNQAKKRPQRPQTSSKNRNQSLRQMRPSSAVQISRKNPQLSEEKKLNRIRQSSVQSEQKVGIQKKYVIKRPLSGQKYIENATDKKRVDQIITLLKQNPGVHQNRCKSSSCGPQIDKSEQKTNGRIRPTSSSQQKPHLYSCIKTDQSQTQINSLIIPMGQQLYQRCKQNGLKKITSLETKVKFIREQRKSRKALMQRNKQNVSCLIKPNNYGNQESIDIKKQLHAKIKQNSQIFYPKNNDRIPLYTPLIKERQFNNEVIRKKGPTNCLQNIKDRLEIRKNNILSSRRYVVSAESKRPKTCEQNHQQQKNLIVKDKNRKFGMIRKIPSNLLPALRSISVNGKQQKSLSQIKEVSAEQEYLKQILDPSHNGYAGKLIEDSDAILRLKKRIKNRITCQNSHQKDRYLQNMSINSRRNQQIYY